ncbi:MAG: hypothetical protein FDZ69_09415 [Deltaproteobacteria bacterium]|nr:MAG: hypothetical protein FDZ69_09415 [Deltaproteobacteria bacterium]
MKRTLLAAVLGGFLLSGCLMYASPEGRGVVVVPPLPALVELDIEPFFFHRGYYYHYHDDHRWSYSESRGGPWRKLPPGHYPKEVRWKKKGPRH